MPCPAIFMSGRCTGRVLNSLRSLALIPESLVIALRETHRLASRDSIALKDLADETLILPSPTVYDVLYLAVQAEGADSALSQKSTRSSHTSDSPGVGVCPAQCRRSVLVPRGCWRAKNGEFRPNRNSRIRATGELMRSTARRRCDPTCCSA